HPAVPGAPGPHPRQRRPDDQLSGCTGRRDHRAGTHPVTMNALEPAMHDASPLSQIPLLREEVRRRPVMLASIFAGIALLALAIGVVLPRKYTSSTTILVQESNIIAPLMEGRAV